MSAPRAAMLEAIPDQNEANKEALRAASEAKAAAENGEWDEARTAMTKAIDGAPDNATYHALMAWYTWQCSIQPAFERQRLAEHHLSVALDMDPDNHQAHYYQGLIWAGGGNTTRARIALSQALALKPNFQAAAQALDKLGKVNEPAAAKESERPTLVKRRKATLILPLAIGTVLMAAIGGATIFYSGQQPGANNLAKQLGMTMPLVSASRVGSSAQDLHMDVGRAWGSAGAADQTRELQNIARGAKALGIVNVFIYSDSQPVGEIHGDAVCVGDCVAKPVMQPTANGQQAVLKVKRP
jgi:tetratricopeptide (TPR) repeat protein